MATGTREVTPAGSLWRSKRKQETRGRRKRRTKGEEGYRFAFLFPLSGERDGEMLSLVMFSYADDGVSGTYCLGPPTPPRVHWGNKEGILACLKVTTRHDNVGANASD